jgi:23S rRNA (adenine2503-C2)-methyltransferase
MTDIKSLTRDELAARFAEWSQPAWRVDQLLQWLYPQRVTDWTAMTNLPKSLREQLRAAFTLRTLEAVRVQGARDTTRKFLWRLSDGAFIESVLIPANPALYGEASDRNTLCVSTQVGCAYGCKFCASGLDGWKRNLTADEIIEQVLSVERWHKKESQETGIPIPEATGEPASVASKAANTKAETRLIDNLVIMGMGEPLANYDHLLRALTILNAPWGGGIGARKITISTSGLVPQIRRLAEEPLQFRLAISLHGATDATRNKIMPVNRKFPLIQLVAAGEEYVRKKGRMITLEYILIAGVNDTIGETRPLAELARRLHAKVNLIPYNAVEGLDWRRPHEAAQEAFLAALERQRVPATLRREKGHDIDAACGQLRLKTERELATKKS